MIRTFPGCTLKINIFTKPVETATKWQITESSAYSSRQEFILWTEQVAQLDFR